MNSQQHRQAQLAIHAATERDMARLLAGLDLSRPATWPAFERAALLLVRARGRVSAGIAHAFYRSDRRAAGILGNAPPMRATPATAEIVAGFRAMRVNAERHLRLLRSLEEVREAAAVNLTGVATKYVLDHGRDVLLHAVQDDPRAKGWSREVAGTACAFCTMLGGRGAVYGSQESASFQSHRHCTCTAAPAW